MTPHQPIEEMDSNYLRAVRLAPRRIGNEAGQCPAAVAARLGLIVKGGMVYAQ